jgi:hypothetical protein
VGGWGLADMMQHGLSPARNLTKNQPHTPPYASPCRSCVRAAAAAHQDLQGQGDGAAQGRRAGDFPQGALCGPSRTNHGRGAAAVWPQGRNPCGESLWGLLGCWQVAATLEAAASAAGVPRREGGHARAAQQNGSSSALLCSCCYLCGSALCIASNPAQAPWHGQPVIDRSVCPRPAYSPTHLHSHKLRA